MPCALRSPFGFASRLAPALCVVAVFAWASSGAAQAPGPALPDNVEVRRVTIWSDGTRIAGDLYTPEGLAASQKRPAIVMSHGWGGTMVGTPGWAARFASHGYVALAFDYRGWGESEGRLVVEGPMPEPDAEGVVTVRAREIRDVIDPWSFVEDIQNAFDWMMGEPQVDATRIGYWGTSYSGGHAVWVAAHEARARCVVGQVAAADSRSLMQTSWKGVDDDIEATIERRAVERARGEAAPLPQGTDKAPNLRGWTYLENAWSYNPVEDAGRIRIPMLLIDAENEELFDRHVSGELAVERAKANGADARYEVIPGIPHYGIYRGEPYEKAFQLALEWFERCLGKAG
jgi:dipeptidyl aminopeptidase/acylaminoacyl peptidase